MLSCSATFTFLKSKIFNVRWQLLMTPIISWKCITSDVPFPLPLRLWKYMKTVLDKGIILITLFDATYNFRPTCPLGKTGVFLFLIFLHFETRLVCTKEHQKWSMFYSCAPNSCKRFWVRVARVWGYDACGHTHNVSKVWNTLKNRIDTINFGIYDFICYSKFGKGCLKKSHFNIGICQNQGIWSELRQ